MEAKFKVVDRIVAARYIATDIHEGITGTVTGCTDDGMYRVNFDGTSDWYSGWILFPDSIIHDKEHRVLQILRQYEDFKRHSNSDRSS